MPGTSSDSTAAHAAHAVHPKLPESGSLSNAHHPLVAEPPLPPPLPFPSPSPPLRVQTQQIAPAPPPLPPPMHYSAARHPSPPDSIPISMPLMIHSPQAAAILPKTISQEGVTRTGAGDELVWGMPGPAPPPAAEAPKAERIRGRSSAAAADLRRDTDPVAQTAAVAAGGGRYNLRGRVNPASLMPFREASDVRTGPAKKANEKAVILADTTAPEPHTTTNVAGRTASNPHHKPVPPPSRSSANIPPCEGVNAGDAPMQPPALLPPHLPQRHQQQQQKQAPSQKQQLKQAPLPPQQQQQKEVPLLMQQQQQRRQRSRSASAASQSQQQLMVIGTSAAAAARQLLPPGSQPSPSTAAMTIGGTLTPAQALIAEQTAHRHGYPPGFLPLHQPAAHPPPPSDARDGGSVGAAGALRHSAAGRPRGDLPGGHPQHGVTTTRPSTGFMAGSVAPSSHHGGPAIAAGGDGGTPMLISEASELIRVLEGHDAPGEMIHCNAWDTLHGTLCMHGGILPYWRGLRLNLR